MTDTNSVTIISRGDDIFAIIDKDGNILIDDIHGETEAEALRNSVIQQIMSLPPVPSGPRPIP